MANRYELRSALQRREPVVVAFDDDREWEFPPDVNSAALLAFQDEHGDEFGVEGGRLPFPVIRAFFRMLLGDQYETVTANTSFLEANDLCWTLYIHYVVLGGKRPEEEQQDDGGEADDRPPSEA